MTALHTTRIQNLQKIMREEAIDAFFIYSTVNRIYFTGLETSNGLLLVEARGEAVFYTDFRYIEVARRTMPGCEIRKFAPQEEQLAHYKELAAGWRRIAYEGSLTTAQFLPLKNRLEPAEFVDGAAHIAKLRAVKSPDELDALRRSAKANDDLFAALIQTIRPGMTELEILRQFRLLLVERDLTESFSPIICAGVNAVECHHQPDGSVLKPGSELLIDMGVKVDRYCSDMTRTLFFGDPTPRFDEIHSLVLRANQAAIAAIKPGIPCNEIDAIARGIITDAGYGDFFDHSLGHSVGLEIHEWPNFSKNTTAPLQPGMVLTVEPGIYIPGDIGVRIEDLICVTETGCEILSHTPHAIIIR